MKAQEIFIYAIIKKKQFKYLKPEYINFFTDPAMIELLKCSFLLHMAQEPITEQTVKNVINNQGYAQAKKEALISQLHELCEEDRYIDFDVVKLIKDEYYTEQEIELKNILLNDRLTPEIKADCIIDTAEKIKQTAKTNNLHKFDDIAKNYIENYSNKNADNIRNNSLEITDYHLANIFGKRIYPQMQIITARPGDCKTTLALNLACHLDDNGHPGAILTMEDDAEMCVIKTLAIKSIIDKDLIFNGQANIEKLKQHQCSKSGNLFIFDEQRTIAEFQNDIGMLLSAYDISWIMIDYVQLFKGEKGQTDYERMKGVADGIFQINRKHKIPVICLSQVNKETMSGGKMLGKGDEKGAGDLAEKIRFGLSLNPSPDNDKSWRLINRYKTTFDPLVQIAVQFHMKSGKINDTRVMDGGE